MHQLSELHATVSLTAYSSDGHLMLTQKIFILIRFTGLKVFRSGDIYSVMEQCGEN